MKCNTKTFIALCAGPMLLAAAASAVTVVATAEEVSLASCDFSLY